MPEETKQILQLIAELARTAAEWRGSATQGLASADATWRDKMEDLAHRAERLI